MIEEIKFGIIVTSWREKNNFKQIWLELKCRTLVLRRSGTAESLREYIVEHVKFLRDRPEKFINLLEVRGYKDIESNLDFWCEAAEKAWLNELNHYTG